MSREWKGREMARSVVCGGDSGAFQGVLQALEGTGCRSSACWIGSGERGCDHPGTSQDFYERLGTMPGGERGDAHSQTIGRSRMSRTWTPGLCTSHVVLCIEQTSYGAVIKCNPSRLPPTRARPRCCLINGGHQLENGEKVGDAPDDQNSPECVPLVRVPPVTPEIRQPARPPACVELLYPQ